MESLIYDCIMQTVKMQMLIVTWNCCCEIDKISCELLIFPLDITCLQVSYPWLVVLRNKFLGSINSMQHRSQNVNISQLVDFSTNAYIKNMSNRNVLAFSTSNSHQF